jgi:MFS transporter, DHA2 family, multidrug resistance protein
MADRPDISEAGLPQGALPWAAFAIALAVIMAVMDGVMLYAALPAIARDIGADPASAIWVVNAYQLAAALVLLPLGKIADIFGYRRVYLICLAIFTAASIGCAFSDGLASLAAWRFIQGCGGAGVLGITNAMLRTVYPPNLLAKGIGLNAMAVALAQASGPSIASFIVEFASWQWLFLINVPIGLLLLAIGSRTFPTRAGSGARFDLPSALLTMATFGLLISAIDAQAHEIGLTLTLCLGVSGIAVAILMVRHQLRQSPPMFPVDLLRTRMFGLSVGTMFCAATAQMMAFVSLPFFFQYSLGRSQIETGLLFLPWPLAVACANFLSSRIGNRFSARLLCSAGLAILALGLFLLAMLGNEVTLWDIVWRMAVCGFGYGTFQPPSSRAVMMSAPIERSGSASVMAASSRVLGQAIGAALVASLFRITGVHGTAITLTMAGAIALLAMLASMSRGSASPTPASV